MMTITSRLVAALLLVSGPTARAHRMVSMHAPRNLMRVATTALVGGEGVRIETSPLPDRSAVVLAVQLAPELTTEAYEAALRETGTEAEARTAALAALLSERVPEAIGERQAELRLVGQAQLHDEEAGDILARFRPGEPLDVRLAADVWPTPPSLSAADCAGLRLRLPRPAHNQSRLDEAILELRTRYSDEGAEPLPLGDELARRVHEDLTMAELDALMRERIARETALLESKQAFAAAEAALLEAVPVPVPESLVVESARATYAARVKKAEAEAVAAEAGDAEALRASLRQMMSWDAFKRFLDAERGATERALSVSFAVQAVIDGAGLEVDAQAMADNMGMYALEQRRRTGVAVDVDDPAFIERFEGEYVRELALRYIVDHAEVEWLDP